ncbi:MAG: LysR substrate-binding domain-containing protein [Beijerinckiaceae bacterium]|nr:LysR substrate-binding domain-containing protein [Beijerinckiaceae bacterium]
MNLRDLQYVVAVADQAHFGHAAQACNVSQPTLSGQIAKLELELGIEIFGRVGRTIRPTEAGEQIIAHARRAIAAAQDIVDAARANRDPLSGRLRLGIIPTIAPYLMPYVLPLTAEKLPNAPLVLVEDTTGNIVPQVIEGKLDAAILATNEDAPELVSIDLYDEPFFVAMPANHPMVAQKEIRVEDIDPKTLLLLTDGHCLREQALELCSHPQVGGGMMADMRATSLETLLHLTAAGQGVTLLPQLAIECGRADTDRLATRPLAGDHAFRRVRLVHRRRSPRTKALIELARIIRMSLPAGVRSLKG